MRVAPIILFVYNRPSHTRSTLEYLLRNPLCSKSDLYVFADGPKANASASQLENIAKTRAVIKEVAGFKTVKLSLSEVNKGLAKSVIAGVTEVLNQYQQAIVLEDDLEVSPVFLQYMNDMLSRYENENAVMSISGWGYPSRFLKYRRAQCDVFFSPRSSSWGWATWQDRWRKAIWHLDDYDDFAKNSKKVRLFEAGGDDLSRMLKQQIDGTVDSWAIRWTYTHFCKGTYCVFPAQTFVKNIGFDGSGVHCEENNESKRLDTNYLCTDLPKKFPSKICMESDILRVIRRVHSRPLRRKVVDRLKQIVSRVI